MHGQLGQGTAKTVIDDPKHIPIIAAETKDKIDGASFYYTWSIYHRS
jgi:hypothetical protein